MLLSAGGGEGDMGRPVSLTLGRVGGGYAHVIGDKGTHTSHVQLGDKDRHPASVQGLRHQFQEGFPEDLESG